MTPRRTRPKASSSFFVGVGNALVFGLCFVLFWGLGFVLPWELWFGLG